jgi:UDP-N-acetylmuramoyl-tripeptide--D-alanyl-D-alanine ligase
MQVAKVLRADMSGPSTKPFPAVSIDTRTLQPREIFWALKGPNHDGHDFLDEAMKKGAAGAVVQRECYAARSPAYPDHIFIGVDDTSLALRRLGAWWRERFDIPVMAITGSLAKTTAKDWAATILKKRYQVFKTPGNRNNLIGLPLALLDLDRVHQVAVVEMGANHEGEIAELCRITDPTHGVITKIAPVHLEGFGDLDGVIRAKKELYDNLGSKGIILAPVDDPHIMNMVRGREIIGYGLGDPPAGVELKQYYRVELAGHSQLGQPILDIDGRRVTMKVVGDLWIPAALAAIAIGRCFQVPVDDIATVLPTLETGPGRLNCVEISGMEIWDDTYNSNPESLKAAIGLILSRPGRRRIIVVGDMLELGSREEELHRHIGAYVKDHPIDAVFTYGNRAQWIAESIPQDAGITVGTYNELDPLCKKLKRYVGPGDVVLFKASRGMYLERLLACLFPDVFPTEPLQH